MRDIVFAAGKEGSLTGAGTAGPSRLYYVDDQLRQNIEGYFKVEETEEKQAAPQALSVSLMYGAIAMMLFLVIMIVRVVRPFRTTRGSMAPVELEERNAELLEAGEGEENPPVE